MKVILQQDVANVGKKFDVADVPNGYALNKLIPSGKAVAATQQNLQAVAARREKHAAEAADDQARFATAVAAIGDGPVQLPMEAGENGQLFQAVQAEHVADAAGESVTPEMIDIPETIKSVGTHELALTMGAERHTFTLEVVASK